MRLTSHDHILVQFTEGYHFGKAEKDIIFSLNFANSCPFSFSFSSPFYFYFLLNKLGFIQIRWLDLV
jgi:hypothetical protein